MQNENPNETRANILASETVEVRVLRGLLIAQQGQSTNQPATGSR